MEVKIETPPIHILPGGQKAFWNMDDLTLFLNLGYTKTWYLIHKYGLPCYRFGGEKSSLRFDPDEVMKWAEEYKVQLQPRSNAKH